jgi:hypothetical protein
LRRKNISKAHLQKKEADLRKAIANIPVYESEIKNLQNPTQKAGIINEQLSKIKEIYQQAIA